MNSEYSLTGAFRTTGPTSAQLDIPIVPDKERLGFSIRKFASQWNLNGAKGGGVHMWREIWDDDVSTIYSDILSKLFLSSGLLVSSCVLSSEMKEPIFGRPPKVDPYAQVKQQKKYIS